MAHSREFDFNKELYQPLRNSILNKEHEIVLPHEESDKPFNSKEFLRDSCDLMIAEVSYPSTGLGIELGWANLYNVTILCVYKKGPKPSESLKVLTSNFLEYSDSKELISGIKDFINN